MNSKLVAKAMPMGHASTRVTGIAIGGTLRPPRDASGDNVSGGWGGDWREKKDANGNTTPDVVHLIRDANASAVKLHRYCTFFNDVTFSDVVITVDDVKFNCHRVVLASNSEYIHKMLMSNMREATTKTIVLHDITSVQFAMYRYFAYHHQEPPGFSSLNGDELSSLYSATHIFDTAEFSDMIWKQLIAGGFKIHAAKLAFAYGKTGFTVAIRKFGELTDWLVELSNAEFAAFMPFIEKSQRVILIIHYIIVNHQRGRATDVSAMLANAELRYMRGFTIPAEYRVAGGILDAVYAAYARETLQTAPYSHEQNVPANGLQLPE